MDSGYEDMPPPKRQKRFRFKTFAQQVAELDVNVSRKLGSVRPEPKAGYSSFFQEELATWREMCTAKHFVESAAFLQPLSRTMAQVVHHRQAIMSHLLDALHMEALLSMEALLPLIPALARDLQQDFVPFLPAVSKRLADLLDEGAESSSEVLEGVFRCLASLLKALARHLRSDLVGLLKCTRRMRYHRATHVRVLCAESLAYSIRQGQPEAVKAGISLIMAEACISPSEEVLSGGGMLISSALLGVQHSLHSRATDLLTMMFDEDVLHNAVTALWKHREQGELAQAYADDADCKELAHGRCMAVVLVAFDRLWEHLRRGQCAGAWSAVLGQADEACQALQQDPNDGTARVAARSVAVVCQALEYHRGGRVEDYGPLFDLANKLVAGAWNVVKDSAAASPFTDQELLGVGDDLAPVACPVLLSQFLRLVRGIVAGHGKVIGASQGLRALKSELTCMAQVLMSVPAGHILPFLCGLITPPEGSPSVAKLYSSCMLGAVGRLVLDTQHTEHIAATKLLLQLCESVSGTHAIALSQRRALLLTAFGCGTQLTEHVIAVASGTVLTASQVPHSQGSTPCGNSKALPHAVAAVGKAGMKAGTGSLSDISAGVEEIGTVSAVGRTAALAQQINDPFAATSMMVQLLPWACASPQQLLAAASSCYTIVQQLLQKLRGSTTLTATTSCSVLDASGVPVEQGLRSADAAGRPPRSLLAVAGQVWQQLALCEGQCSEQQRKQLDIDVIEVIKQHGQDVAVLEGGWAWIAARSAGQFTTKQLQEVLPCVQSNISRSCASLRAVTLKLLCAFAQPEAPLATQVPSAAHSPASDGDKEGAAEPSDCLHLLKQVMSVESSVDHGRTDSLTIARLQGYFEYERVPDMLVEAVVHGLLGVLQIRFAALWSPAVQALGMALRRQSQRVCPLVYTALQQAQHDFIHCAQPGVANRDRRAPQRLRSQRFAQPMLSEPPQEAAVEHDHGSQQLKGENSKGAKSSVPGKGGNTDAATRLTQVLQAVRHGAPVSLEVQPAEWVQLFLELEASKPGGAATAGVEQKPRWVCAGGGKAWRSAMKGWLDLLSGYKGVRGLPEQLRQRLQWAVAQQLSDTDTTVQQSAIKCLKVFKLAYINPYIDQLLRFASNTTLRSALTTFDANSETEGIAAQHRPEFMSALIRVLFPALRKRTGRLGGKGAPGSARAAILNFMAALAPGELVTLFEMSLTPWATCFASACTISPSAANPSVLPRPWWGPCLGDGTVNQWMSLVSSSQVAMLPFRQKQGMLHLMEDIITHCGFTASPYAPAMLACAVMLLQSFSSNVMSQADGAVGSTADSNAKLTGGADSPAQEHINGPEESDDEPDAKTDVAAPAATAAERKALVGGSVRLIASVLRSYPDVHDYNPLWPQLLPCIANMAHAVHNEAAADRPPAVMELVATLLAAANLAPVLANRGSVRDSPPNWEHILSAQTDVPAAWQREQLGSLLLSSCIGALGAPSCSPASAAAAYSAVSTALSLPDGFGAALLYPHLQQLLKALQFRISGSTSISLPHIAPPSDSERPQDEAADADDVVADPEEDDNATHIPTLTDGAATYQAEPQADSQAVGSRVVAPAGDLHTPQCSKAQRRDAAPQKDRSVKGPGSRGGVLRALTIVELLCQQLDLGLHGLQLSSSLLPVLQECARRRHAASAELTAGRTLQVLSKCWAGSAAAAARASVPVDDWLQVMAVLQGNLSDRSSREALCAAFTSLAQISPSLSAVAALLTSMNSWSQSVLDEADYKARLDAYSTARAAFWQHLPAQHANTLLQQCCRDLRNGDDLSLRQAAATALEYGIAAAEQQRKLSSDGAAGAGVLSLVCTVLYGQLKRGLSANSLAVRQEHLMLLRRCVHSFPENFEGMQQLLDEDVEVDFFHNIAHLQLHRRMRALTRLRSLLEAQQARGSAASETDRSHRDLSLGDLSGVILPLLQQMIFEGIMQEGARHEGKQIDKDREATLKDQAVTTLGAVAAILPWTQYQQLLGFYMRRINSVASKDGAQVPKPYVRALCAILDAFHFTDQLDGEVTNGSDVGEKITNYLSSRALPALGTLLVQDGVIRPHVALVTVKLLKALPEAMRRMELPRTVRHVANALKSRTQSVRDGARSVLLSITSELGSDCLPFVIQVLTDALPSEGYTGQVLGYTLHSLLAAVVKDAEEGAGDLVLPLALPIIEDEVFGMVGEAKDAKTASSGLKETKQLRAYDSFQLLATMVNLRECIGDLLQPVQSRLDAAGTPAINTKLVKLLTAAAHGVAKNPTCTPPVLATIVHELLSQGLAVEEEAKGKVHAEASAHVSHNGKRKDRQTDNVSSSPASLHLHLLMEFGLSLLHTGIKKGPLDGRDPSTLQLLNTLLPLLIRCLSCRQAATVTMALKCLVVLLDLPLSGLATCAPAAGDAVAVLLKRTPTATHPIAQECFKLLSAMLRSCQGYRPTDGQLRHLLSWAFSDLEAPLGRQTAFSLLKAILARKLMVPEVYDVINRVQEIMVQSHTASLRELSSQVFMTFLLDYPVGPRRLSGHIQFLVTNLEYEHESGRLSTMSVLRALISRFPPVLVEEWGLTLLLPLLTRVVNDESASCRKEAAAVLSALMSVLQPGTLQKAVGYAVAWLKGNDVRLRRAALQFLCILVEVEGRKAARRVEVILPLLLPILAGHADAAEELSPTAGEAEADEDSLPNLAAAWHEAYYGCKLIEKLLPVASQQLAWQAGEEVQLLWETVLGLLLYPHVWVRNASGRLIERALRSPLVGPPLLDSSASCAGIIVYKLYKQLETPQLDEKLASQAAATLPLALPALYAQDVELAQVPETDAGTVAVVAPPLTPQQACTAAQQQHPRSHGASIGDHAVQHVESTSIASAGQADFSTHTGMAQDVTTNVEGTNAAIETGDADEDDAEDAYGTSAGAQRVSVEWVVRKLSRLATQNRSECRLAREVSLRLLGAVVKALGVQRSVPFLPLCLQPLYRIIEGVGPPAEAQLQQLAAEVMAEMRELVGSDTMLVAYNMAREAIRLSRGKRRQAVATQRLLDPELAAKVKLARRARRQHDKKRKLEEHKRQRDAGVRVKNRKVAARVLQGTE